MSGVKRRTKHRKQVQSDVLDSFHQPKENQIIVRIVQSHGSNILEVCAENAAQDVSSAHCDRALQVEAPDGDHGKCMLPTKYRKLIWVKRGALAFFLVLQATAPHFLTAAGDFLIVTQADGAYDTAASDKGGTVKFMVEHILTAQSIKKLKQDGLWPAEFETTLGSTAGVTSEGADMGGQQILAPHENVDAGAAAAAAGSGMAESKTAEGATDASGEGDADDVLDGVFVNRNRRRVYVDSEEDSDSSSDGDSD